MDLQDFDDDIVDELMKISDAVEQSDNAVQQTPSRGGQPGPEHLNILSKYFGHKSFRPMQWEIISAIMDSRRDVCAVMSTGYGKSLCYQYPSTFLGGITLVISPLISLMEDQVLSLEVSNIPACLLGTAQKNQSKVIENIFLNKYSIIYLTPEFCTGDTGSNILKRMSNELSVVLIGIDEAHCISSWGHEFRYQYRNLGFFHDMFPGVPIVAVTATATSAVKRDIVQNLKMRDPLVVCSGFDRPNLYFEVNSKSPGGVYRDMTKAMVYVNNNWKFSGPTIVYCITRKQTEEIAQVLRTNGIKCLPYHAGLPLSARQEAHEQFVKDKIDVIVATIAFGMGIDKPDVRNVVHYGSSKSLENYYQEVGRAGRDGLPSNCVCFYSNADFVTLRNMTDFFGGSKTRIETNLKTMEEYLTTRNCRRRFILQYFEDKVENLEQARKNCCNNCTKKLYDGRTDQDKYEGIDDNGCYDFSNDARIFLKAVFTLSGNFGVNTYILFLRGSKSSKIAQSKQKDPLHGSGKHQSDDWWKAIAKILVQEKYLDEKTQKTMKGFTYKAISLNEKGKKMMTSDEQLLLPPPSSVLGLLKCKPQKQEVWLTTKRISLLPSTSKTAVAQSTETRAEIDERMELYKRLLDVRTKLASDLDCMPYMVASNATLMSMSRLKPKSLDELRNLNIDGLTEAKINKFGNEFLKVITNDSNVGSDNRKRSIKDILVAHPLSNVAISLSAEVSCTMFQSGSTVGEIASKRGAVPGTITSHLISGIKFGHPIKMIELGVGEETRDTVIKTYRKFCASGFTNVKTKQIKEECPPDLTYDQINTVLAYLQVRCHLQNLNVPYEEFEEFQFSEVDVREQDEVDRRLESLINLGKEIGNKEDLDSVCTPDLVSESSNKENFQYPTPPSCDDSALEPPRKKEKTDYDFILDSPPRHRAASAVTERSESADVKSESADVKAEPREVDRSTDSSTGATIKKAKKKSLPPWLVVKKIN